MVPSTEEEALFLGRRTKAYFMGMSIEESETLVDALCAQPTQPQFCYRHKWKGSQVVVWDNRMIRCAGCL